MLRVRAGEGGGGGVGEWGWGLGGRRVGKKCVLELVIVGLKK